MMDQVAHDVLMAYPFYRDGAPAFRQTLREKANVFDEASVKSQHLYRVGDFCENIYLVGIGHINVYVSGISGPGVLLYCVCAGEVCPVNVRMALAGTVALANATPSADLRGVWLHSRDVRDLSARYREFRGFVQQSVVERFEEIIMRISDITTRRVDQRLLDFLLREFERSSHANPTIVMTQEQIALAIGTAREVVSRKLHEFEAIEAVKLGRGRIWLHNIERLHELLPPKKRAS